MITLPETIDTLFVLIVDRSGSMSPHHASTVKGMNEFISTQKEKGVKNSYVHLVQFDSRPLHTTFNMVPLEKTRMLGMDDYDPQGGTPLYQTIMNVITEIRPIVEKVPAPPAVVVQIITDGQDTSGGRPYTHQDVTTLIKHMEEVIGGWTFVLGGANMDATKLAESIGIAATNSFSYSAGKTEEAFRGIAIAASSYSLSNSAARSVDRSARFSTQTYMKDAGVDVEKLK